MRLYRNDPIPSPFMRVPFLRPLKANSKNPPQRFSKHIIEINCHGLRLFKKQEPRPKSLEDIEVLYLIFLSQIGGLRHAHSFFVFSLKSLRLLKDQRELNFCTICYMHQDISLLSIFFLFGFVKLLWLKVVFVDLKSLSNQFNSQPLTYSHDCKQLYPAVVISINTMSILLNSIAIIDVFCEKRGNA